MPPLGMLWPVTARPELQLCQAAPNVCRWGQGTQITAPRFTCNVPANAEQDLGRGGGSSSTAPCSQRSSELPRLSTLPALDFWLLLGLEQDPLDELGTTKPQEPGPPLAPQMGPGGGVKPAASWADGGTGKWGSPLPSAPTGARPHWEGAAAPSSSAKPPLLRRVASLWKVSAGPGRPSGLSMPQNELPKAGRPPQGHGSAWLPTKTCLAALHPQHPPGRDEADSERWKCLNSSEDNSRQGERKKILSAIFCRFLFNLKTKTGFVREGVGGCSWKFLGFSP